MQGIISMCEDELESQFSTNGDRLGLHSTSMNELRSPHGVVHGCSIARMLKECRVPVFDSRSFSFDEPSIFKAYFDILRDDAVQPNGTQVMVSTYFGRF